MTADEQGATPRPGSTVDLSRRMDRMETNYDDLAKEVGSLRATVGRVELNQEHAEQLNTLRFGALDTAVKTIDTKLEAFMTRIEGIITGEIQTAQTKQGAELLAEHQTWRASVESRLDKHDTFETQGRLLARIAVLLFTSNVIAFIAALAALMKPS